MSRQWPISPTWRDETMKGEEKVREREYQVNLFFPRQIHSVKGSLNSRSLCLSLLSVGITSIYHHSCLKIIFKIRVAGWAADLVWKWNKKEMLVLVWQSQARMLGSAREHCTTNFCLQSIKENTHLGDVVNFITRTWGRKEKAKCMTIRYDSRDRVLYLWLIRDYKEAFKSINNR